MWYVLYGPDFRHLDFHCYRLLENAESFAQECRDAGLIAYIIYRGTDD